MTTDRTIITMLFFAVCLAILPATRSRADSALAGNAPAYKILHIMSYHSPWRWSDGQLNGFKDALKDLNIEYRVFQMDTKRHSGKQWKLAKGLEARTLIEIWQPDLVYATDDDAQAYVTKHFINKDTPFVFSGVQNPPEIYGFPGSRNIAGVLEHELFTESIQLLQDIVPKVRRIAVVFDDQSIWLPMIQRMKQTSAQLDDVELIALDTIKTFTEYKQKIKEYQLTADAIALIGVFKFKDAQGANVPLQDVLKWTAENSRLPDFSFWSTRVHYGTLCAVNVSEYHHGVAAGRIARSILTQGKSPSAFSMAPSLKGYPIVSLARANKLGIRIKSKVLLTAEVVRHFEWDRQ
jgi:ABC-type uncharacterized transport system substrate-binding protein